ncbi:MAG: aldo/keto reductase [Acidobacteria bacterium]|nr:aldo/keto reductase [Acidobacteriota bacterium]
MRQRPLGATGLRVSEVSFGAHGLDNADVMLVALEAGINTFCTSGSYLDGAEERALGRILRRLGSRRDDVVLFTGEQVGRDATKESLLAAIDASLRRLATDRIEVFYVAAVDAPSELRHEAIHEAFRAARQAGKVRHLGLSGHCGGMQSILNAALDDGRYEVFFTKHDFVSYPDQAAILHRAAERGIGTLVFKTNAGHREREIHDLEKEGLSFRQATIRWALANSDIASVCVTLAGFADVDECVAAIGAPLTASEGRMLRRYAVAMHGRYCRFCRTCEGRCPRGVRVADVMRFEMYHSCYGRQDEACASYDALGRDRSAASCQRCAGPCDAACPFGRKVREGLVAAHGRLRRAPA